MSLKGEKITLNEETLTAKSRNECRERRKENALSAFPLRFFFAYFAFKRKHF